MRVGAPPKFASALTFPRLAVAKAGRSRSRAGSNRVKEGLPAGWMSGHKDQEKQPFATVHKDLLEYIEIGDQWADRLRRS